MVMAYLITQGRTVQEAIEVVKSKHPDVWSPGNPTTKYTEMLEAYAKLKTKKEPDELFDTRNPESVVK